ncbi:MAG TPA: hypothetical protein VFS61_06310 [Anaerolineales bacterium]|nr:hypothetical protein [Anaerolineales bacterium]
MLAFLQVMPNDVARLPASSFCLNTASLAQQTTPKDLLVFTKLLQILVKTVMLIMYDDST